MVLWKRNSIENLYGVTEKEKMLALKKIIELFQGTNFGNREASSITES
jgi:hypothetical protein